MGTDGGIYKSNDGADTWSDVINEGLCITQFGFIDQHPSSDALILAGTQDNGTLQFRNSPAFYHSADGDGGFVAIDPNHPNIMLHEYFPPPPSPERSEEAGRFNADDTGSWVDISSGLSGTENSLFYPPFALDQSNSLNVAFGTDRIFLDSDQGLKKWKSSVLDLGFSSQSNDERGPEVVSTISYINSDPGLIYAGSIS